MNLTQWDMEQLDRREKAVVRLRMLFSAFRMSVPEELLNQPTETLESLCYEIVGARHGETLSEICPPILARRSEIPEAIIVVLKEQLRSLEDAQQTGNRVTRRKTLQECGMLRKKPRLRLARRA